MDNQVLVESERYPPSHLAYQVSVSVFTAYIGPDISD